MSDSAPRSFPGLEALATRFLALSGVVSFLLVALIVRSATSRAAIVLLAVGAVSVICAFVLPRRLRPGVMLTVIVGVILVWLANAALVIAATRAASHDLALRRDAAVTSGYEFDARSRRQVITDARREGRHLVPTVDPQGLMTEDSNRRRVSVLRASTSNRELLTLGGISNVATLLCNEVGRNIEYLADEHGFRNEPGSWSRPADVLMVGDSFAHGVCVPDKETIPGLLRAQGFRVISAAYSGNGPLLELAAVREYARALRPRAVVWALYEGNDLDVNLPRETMSPLLRTYLDDPRFSQDLLANQSGLDQALSEYVEKQLGAPTTEDKGNWDVAPKGLWDLSPLKGLVRQLIDPPRTDLTLFERVLDSARSEVAGWGGKLVILYLPGVERWRGKERLQNSVTGTWDGYYNGVKAIANRLQIPFIDALPTMDREVQSGAALLFPFKAHYAAAGYEAASRPLIDWLRADERSWSK